MKDAVCDRIREAIKQVQDADMLLMLLLKSQARLVAQMVSQENIVKDPSRSLTETIEISKLLKTEMLEKLNAIYSEQTKQHYEPAEVHRIKEVLEEL